MIEFFIYSNYFLLKLLLLLITVVTVYCQFPHFFLFYAKMLTNSNNKSSCKNYPLPDFFIDRQKCFPCKFQITKLHF